MSAQRRLKRTARSLFFFVWGLLPASAAWAQGGVIPGKDTKSYLTPYVIVAAVVGLGVFSLCRPSRRLDTEKRASGPTVGKGLKGEEFHGADE